MFTQLVASRPVRERATAGIGASLVVHGLLVTAAVWAAMGTHVVEAPSDVVGLVYVPPQAVRPRTAVAVVPSAPARVATNLNVAIEVPIAVPDVLPVVDLARARDGSAWPTASTFGSGGIGGALTVPGPATGGAYLIEQVDEPAAIERGSPLPVFPALLRSAGMEGTSRFQFVVDTLGRVEMGSVREVMSTQPGFGMAVRGVLPRMRFVAARVGGRRVRQLVEFPVVFRIER